ncbi:GNAT family N-acetyltransferase, partial [Sporosarcina sp. NCCP-2331]
MDISIEKLKSTDQKNLYAFELENRAFFEEMVLSRGNDYYKPEIFRSRHRALLAEQSEGISYFYLIKDQEGTILGRINLVDINKNSKTGHLGYRVGQQHTGKGIAKTALQLLLEKVSELGIKQILAKTTSNNTASQKVLKKNGFTQMEDSNDEFEMNGLKLKFVSYSWT